MLSNNFSTPDSHAPCFGVAFSNYCNSGYSNSSYDSRLLPASLILIAKIGLQSRKKPILVAKNA